MKLRKTVTISHDPFARTELVRRVTSDKGLCGWCGRNRRSAWRRIAGLFEYGIHADDNLGYGAYDGKHFCCKSCRDSYYS